LPKFDIEDMSEQYIELKGIRVHNLKNIDLRIKLNQLIVLTGVSGSGKSSLAFDTLYAEGQRRYVESLSAYARQFLGRLNKPECDYIKGIPPAIAIEQKVNTSNARSTVGTSTELYDYLKLLYARVGKTISPVSGQIVKRYSADDICHYITQGNTGKSVIILTKISIREAKDLLSLANQGFSRVKYGNEFFRIADFVDKQEEIDEKQDLFLVVDRLVVNEETDTVSRVTDSVETALQEGDGVCYIELDGVVRVFSNKFESDGITFEEPSINLFSFNSPVGACPKCEGYGRVLGIDEDLVVPDKSLSLYDDAVACWRGEKMSEWKRYFIKQAHKKKFPVHTPYYELTEKEKDILWNDADAGINTFFGYLESQKYKIQNRVMIARFTGKTTCPACHGKRLKKEAEYVKIGGKAITDLVDIPISELKVFFDELTLSEYDQQIADRVLPDIQNRITCLLDVGLGYLTLNRLSSSLSGGESQRINLVTSLGSALVGSLYILDEPSIGLHSRDTERLIQVLQKLKRLGNTVIVVEHDEDIIRAADEVIDVGPLAGSLGGEIVFQGDWDAFMKSKTLTALYLQGKETIPVPTCRRKWTRSIQLHGAMEHNLKNIDVEIPLGVMTVVSGVSGSGKSTLVKSILVPLLKRYYENPTEHGREFNKLTGDLSCIHGVEFIDQNPLGKSTRSNPVTYIKAWDDIRRLFSETTVAKRNNFKSSYFSFNVPGGRCEACLGEGITKVEMQFMADVYLECEHCKGRRFKDEILEVKFREKSIYDILEMTVQQAVEFFNHGDSCLERNIVNKLQKLLDVGLGYIKLGQTSSTLSGGECQRVKLAYHLSQENTRSTLFVFDEPTTGLHFHDIHKLMESLTALLDRGHTVLIIEHNMDVIKCADHIIDLGPEGGKEGGYVLYQGTPEGLVKQKESYTGKYLREKLNV